MAGLHAASFMNANRDPKKQPQPIVLPTPWPAEGRADEVTAEEHAALKASLLRRSAFA